MASVSSTMWQIWTRSTTSSNGCRKLTATPPRESTNSLSATRVIWKTRRWWSTLWLRYAVHIYALTSYGHRSVIFVWMVAKIMSSSRNSLTALESRSLRRPLRVPPMSSKPSWPWQDRSRNGWARPPSTTSPQCRSVRAKESNPVLLEAAARWDDICVCCAMSPSLAWSLHHEQGFWAVLCV